MLRSILAHVILTLSSTQAVNQGAPMYERTPDHWPRFEYKVLDLRPHNGGLEAYLNELGDTSWEIISINTFGGVAKRPIRARTDKEERERLGLISKRDWYEQVQPEFQKQTGT